MRLRLVFLLLVLLACETVDAPREVTSPTDPAAGNMAMALRADGAGADIMITIPRYTGFNPALVPPITTFRWETAGGVEPPDSVSWILESAQDGFAQTIAYLRDQFDAVAWSPWHAYDPDHDAGTSWTTPPIDFGPYILAVRSKTGDETNRVLDEQLNLRRIRVATRSSGPVLTLTSNVHDPIITSVTGTPVTIVNVPAGLPIEFCWTADAEAYGGVVERHRYGWDIIDPGDPDAWDVVAEYYGNEFCLEPRTFFFGTHTFTLEVTDNSDYSARIPVRINVTAPPEPISLDIRPGACPNPVNPTARGVLSVALPGSNDLDVHDVDLGTLTLGQLPDFQHLASPVHSMVHDVTRPAAVLDECDCSDRGHDGIDDLVLKFSLRDLRIDAGASGDVQLALIGQTASGESFMAVDCVRLVPGRDGDEPEPQELDTEIVQVWNTYLLDGRWVTEPINTSDALPDTVPQNSWVTLFYDGATDAATASACTDPVNQCIGYQVAYTRSSPYHPGGTAQSGWLPRDGAEDNDPFARPDSTSMNLGTMNYRLQVRTVDVLNDIADVTPAEIEIVSNFQPTLTHFDVENYDGTGPDVVWDWWNPSNFHGNTADTLDVSGGGVDVVREFYFVINGEGRDHPKERDRGGVKQWLYTIHPAGDPSQIVPLGRSGIWVEATQVNELHDVIRFTVRYSLLDDPGGWKAWAALPDWIGQAFDITLRGRDTALGEEFRQYVFVNGDKALINQYPVSVFGRQTGDATVRTSISITRDDLPAARATGRPGLSRR